MTQGSRAIPPADIEEPTPILFWSPLEFILAISFLGLGIISNLWVIGLLGAAGILVGSKHLKRGAKRGGMQHLIWSLGLQIEPAMSNSFPPSWKNEFIE
ncbi:MAG: type IV conjugative transfer system protein TraL [Burkholderiaceae bacterium]|nr:type IV conjugative transfer system protein TraL [Burkholderiaceae bacterium]